MSTCSISSVAFVTILKVMFIDIIILIFLVSAAFRGHEIGLIRQLLSAAGFIAGLFAGAAMQPLFIDDTANALTQAVLSLLLALTGALMLLSIGEFIGIKLKRRLMGVMQLNKADAVGGSVAGAVSIILATWLLAPSLANLPDKNLDENLDSSRIIELVDQSLPSAPSFIAALDKIINPNGFPDVFADLERKPLDDGTPLPELGDLKPAVERSRASVVKLEGKGCGGIVEGSGYVAAPGIVITNAHVIAGVDLPTVVDANGRHDATPLWFDSRLDIAVLRVTGLAGQPLAAGATKLPDGTATAVLGYPGGGSFRAGAATVLDQFMATGRDIYGRERTNRNIYELKADIIPGNSGGPLIDATGQVVGLIFAESTSYENIGYALTMTQVNDALQRAQARNTAVGTGACAE